MEIHTGSLARFIFGSEGHTRHTFFLDGVLWRLLEGGERPAGVRGVINQCALDDGDLVMQRGSGAMSRVPLSTDVTWAGDVAKMNGNPSRAVGENRLILTRNNFARDLVTFEQWLSRRHRWGIFDMRIYEDTTGLMRTVVHEKTARLDDGTQVIVDMREVVEQVKTVSFVIHRDPLLSFVEFLPYTEWRTTEGLDGEQRTQSVVYKLKLPGFTWAGPHVVFSSPEELESVREVLE